MKHGLQTSFLIVNLFIVVALLIDSCLQLLLLILLGNDLRTILSWMHKSTHIFRVAITIIVTMGWLQLIAELFKVLLALASAEVGSALAWTLEEYLLWVQ